MVQLPRYASMTFGFERISPGFPLGDFDPVIQDGDAFANAHHDLHVVFNDNTKEIWRLCL